MQHAILRFKGNFKSQNRTVKKKSPKDDHRNENERKRNPEKKTNVSILAFSNVLSVMLFTLF